MLVTVGTAPLIRPATRRFDRFAAAASADYQAMFERLDRMAAELRADGWPEGAEIVQRKAEIAYRAARAERFQKAVDAAGAMR